MYSLLDRHISVFLFMPLTFEIIHTCLSIQKANGHEVLSDSHKYFTFVSHNYLSSPMNPWVFFVWQSYLVLSQMLMVFLLQFINILYLAVIFAL